MSRLQKIISHPWTAIRHIKAKLTRPFISPPNDRVNILDADWDNLIILDACRFDMFKKNNILDGELSRIYSTASQTAEFVKKNITQTYPDVVYVTASPQLAGQENKFHHIEHLWKDHWDDDVKTVTPSEVTKRAIEIAEKYPEKRLIVHYMQPHYPFIGTKGRELGEHATFTGSVEDRAAPSVWDLLASRKVGVDEVMAAYEENLEIVLPHIQKLITDLSGKTVVSSDHGNLFRKKVSWLPIRIEGHPDYFPDDDLLAVPWLELPFKSRKRITEQSSYDVSDSPDEEVVKDRLEDLGYLS